MRDSDSPLLSSTTPGDRRAWPPRLGHVSAARGVTLVACLLALIGLVGIVRTYAGMDDLQQTEKDQYGGMVTADSPLSRLVPGLIANPASYLAALNGGGRGGRSSPDAFFVVRHLALKQAMDRWEALACAGLAVVFLGRARPRSATAAAAGSSPGVDTAVGTDLAPLLLLAAVLFALLSFLEIG